MTNQYASNSELRVTKQRMITFESNHSVNQLDNSEDGRRLSDNAL